MFEHVERCPLSWPGGWKRTRPSQREFARFSKRRESKTPFGLRTVQGEVTIHAAVSRLSLELGRLVGATHAVMSTNVPTRLDGLPYSNSKEPDDPGAAVYFFLDGRPRCLACDKWNRVADNLVAIAKHVEALRGIDRWGVGTMEQAFAGYLALPPAAEEWWLILGVGPDATKAEIEVAYRKLAQETHPDRGGDENQMAKVNIARDAALASA